jgi:hypothetical protein
MGEPQARVVAQSRRGALVEVTCGCGCKIQLECQFETPDGESGGQ